MVLTAYSALSLVTGLCCHHRQRDAVRVFANLMPASGHQDHTASPSASKRASSCALPRPPHPAPNVRDDREPPLLGAQDGRGDKSDFSSKGSEISLPSGLDTPCAKQPVGQISTAMAQTQQTVRSRCRTRVFIPEPSSQRHQGVTQRWSLGCQVDPGPQLGSLTQRWSRGCQTDP
jgi:hypothetical protein